jgi:molybdopterin converting factor small subunit
MPRVAIPSPLFSYTGGAAEVRAEGSTLDQVLRALDRRYPGIRFRVVDEQDRIREHVRMWVSGRLAKGLDVPVGETDEVMIVAALSGG